MLQLITKIKKNAISILLVLFIILIWVRPDVKSWLIQQVMVTGIFNANIDEQKSDKTDQPNLDFDFEREDGLSKNTSELRGKVLFINFWASWCPPCRAEFPSIEKLYSKFKGNPDILFLTINEDEDLSAAKSYINQEKLTLPFYKTMKAVPKEIYNGTLPTTIVMDKNGKIRYRHEGFANYASEKFIQQVEELISE